MTNTQSYNVSLDTSFMEDVNGTLLALLDICRAEGVTWTDKMCIRDRSCRAGVKHPFSRPFSK